MKQKIEWYREVLELEPNSRVFFTLARLEYADGQTDAAIATLHDGVQRHPDHVEARLFLADLLFSSGNTQELWQEVEHVSVMFGAYPGFWAAWSERLAQDAKNIDASLAVRFLASCLQGKQISWAEVIASGLKQILPSSSHVSFASQASITENISDSKPASVSNSCISDISERDLHLADDAEDDLVDQEQDIKEPASNITQLVTNDTDFDNDDDDGESEEPFSLRTRSMADVLMEQGDFSGSLEIYRELLAASVDPTEQDELNSWIKDLEVRLLEHNESSHAVPVDEDHLKGTGKNRLLDVLESLAQRLEARI